MSEENKDIQEELKKDPVLRHLAAISRTHTEANNAALDFIYGLNARLTKIENELGIGGDEDGVQ